jgi:YVTN family beta-propeller protein
VNITRRIKIAGGLCLLLIFSNSTYAQIRIDSRTAASEACLPTGVCLDPAGPTFVVGNMPLSMAISPEGDRIVLSLSGWREQGLQVVERDTGDVVQTISQPSAFLGLTFSNDGGTLYASGGNEDVIYRYAWRDKQATLVGTIVLATKEPKKDGTRFPAGIALSRDGKKLFVAENLADSLAVIDLASDRVVQRVKTEAYPYGVIVAPMVASMFRRGAGTQSQHLQRMKADRSRNADKSWLAATRRHCC